MIVRLTGTLVEVGEEAVVVERDGVGREVLVPAFALGDLTIVRGREVTLHTLEYLEGSSASGNSVPRLIGFLAVEDRRFFSVFIAVKGIGPRKALKALAQPVRSIATWIESGDTAQLARLPGIGKRAAELVVASLRGKLEAFALGAVDTQEPVGDLTPAQRDALEILVAWGDPRVEAQRWLAKAAERHAGDVDTPDEWVRAAYRVKVGAAD